MKFVSRINIISSKSAKEKIDGIFSKVDKHHKTSLIDNFYNSDIRSHQWMRSNTSCDWVKLEDDYIISSCEFLPIKFFSHLYNILASEDSGAIIEVRFRHDSNEPVGSILFKDGRYIISEEDFDIMSEDSMIEDVISRLMHVCYQDIGSDYSRSISYREID